MRFGSRLQAAIEVLADIETRHRPAGDALKDWGLSHRFAGSGDRAAIGNVVYDALRWLASSAWAFGDDTPRGLVLATVARRWGIGAAGLAERVAGDPRAPPPLTAAETARLDGADLAEAPPHVRADVPEWLAARFARAFGDDWVADGEGLARRPPLDMRVNRLKADRAKVAKALSRFGAVETPYSPDGLRVSPTTGEGRHPNVQAESAFAKGWFEVQDEGSQIAALMASAKPGEQVLDLCAGSGGKTLAVAAAMANRGQVFATDRDRPRLAPIFARIRRAGTRNVQVRDAGAPLNDLTGRMDAVLIDAPCTGAGAWRRRPDAKWRLGERALAERVKEQAAVLKSAVPLVKSGGRLVYVTCSLLPDENADRVEEFLAAAPDFVVVVPRAAIAAADLGESLAEAVLLGEEGVTLTPRRTGTDGFFIAVMHRQ